MRRAQAILGFDQGPELNTVRLLIMHFHNHKNRRRLCILRNYISICGLNYPHWRLFLLTFPHSLYIITALPGSVSDNQKLLHPNLRFSSLTCRIGGADSKEIFWIPSFLDLLLVVLQCLGISTGLLVGTNILDAAGAAHAIFHRITANVEYELL